MSLDGYAIALHLTPLQTKLFGLLMARDLIQLESIHNDAGITMDGKVAISRLRQHLKQLHKSGRIPFEVEVCGKRRVGYWLTKETKDNVGRFVSERTVQSAPADGDNFRAA